MMRILMVDNQNIPILDVIVPGKLPIPASRKNTGANQVGICIIEEDGGCWLMSSYLFWKKVSGVLRDKSISEEFKKLI